MKCVSTTKVQTAIAKAYNGSTTALSRAFPELKKVQLAYEKQHGKVKNLAAATDVGRLMIKALAKESKGMAAEQATPFDKINVAADDMKEKLGNLILPKLTDFMNTLMTPGGAVDKLGQFLQDSGNPKTDAGKAFKDMGEGMKSAVDGVNSFFAAFDPKKKSGVAGFLKVMGLVGNVASGVGALPEFLSTGKISDFVMKNSRQVAKKLTLDVFPNANKSKGKGKPMPMPTPSAQASVTYVINAKNADAQEVLKLIREHERRNGTAWRK
jgi:hypothetical protein